MKIILHKICVLFVICCFFLSVSARPANALFGIDDVFIVGSVVGHAIVGGVAYYVANSHNSGANKSDLTVRQQATAKWYDLTGPNGTPKLNQKEVVLAVKLDDANSSSDSSTPNFDVTKKSYYGSPPNGTIVVDGNMNRYSLTLNPDAYPNPLERSFPKSSVQQSDIPSGMNYGPGTATYVTIPYTSNDGLFWISTYTYYYKTPTTDTSTSPWTYGGATGSPSNSPASPQQADAINNSPPAKAEIPSIVKKVKDKDKSKVAVKKDCQNFVNDTCADDDSTPATREQIAAADNKEYNAQRNSLRESASNADKVAANNPSQQNLDDANKWRKASNDLEFGGPSSMAPGYPISSGGSFPRYNGTSTSPGTNAPPNIDPFNNPNIPGYQIPGSIAYSGDFDSATNGIKYDGYADGEKPVKSDIKTAIQTFINSSPLVALVKKLTVTTSSANSRLSFVFHGQTIDVDFGRYGDFLATAGTALLGLSHMYSLYIIFRREG